MKTSDIVRYIKLFLIPLISTLVLFSEQTRLKRLYFMEIIIYGYLITEVIPMPVTSVLVIFMSPIFYIDTSFNLTSRYFGTAGLNLSAMLNGLTLQYSGLHERFTLWLILKLGCTPRKITCGLLIVSHILSIWLSNTFTTNIMVPIALKIYENTMVHYNRNLLLRDNQIETSWVKVGVDRVRKNTPINMGVAYMFAIIFGAMAGGLTFSRGSPTNITYLIIYNDRFKCHLKSDVWFFFVMPISVLISIVNCLWLLIAFLGLFDIPYFRPEQDMKQFEDILKNEKPIEHLYNKIGPFTWHEGCVAFTMILCFFMWVMRDPYTYDGWSKLLTDYYIEDSSVTIFISVLMVIIPSDNFIFWSFSKNNKKRANGDSYGLVTWLVFQKNLSWGDFFLIGCINMLGTLQNKIGLNTFLAKKLMFLKGCSLPMVIIIVSFTVMWATEVMMNAILSSIVSPTIIELAILLNFHPMSISFLSCLCCSLTFINPIASRSSKIVKNVINLKFRNAFKAGFVPKMMSYFILTGLYLTFGKYTFFQNELSPGWIFKEGDCYCWPCGRNETRASLSYIDEYVSKTR